MDKTGCVDYNLTHNKRGDVNVNCICLRANCSGHGSKKYENQ